MRFGKKTLSIQIDENEKMAAHNHAIEADIIELKSGDQTLEEQARYELDMVKEDEVFINLLINGFYKEQKEYVLS